MNFDYFNSHLIKIVKDNRFFKSVFFSVIKILGGILLIFSIFSVVFDLLGIIQLSIAFQFISYLLFALLGIYFFLEFFMLHQINHFKEFDNLFIAQKSKKSINYANYLSLESALLIDYCIQITKNNKLKQIDSSILLIAFAHNDQIRWILTRMGIFIDQEVEKQIIGQLDKMSDVNEVKFSSDFDKIINRAIALAIKNKRLEITIHEIFLAFAELDGGFKKIMFDYKITIADIYQIVNWRIHQNKLVKNTPFWEKKYYGEGIGRNWAAGYTPLLNNFASDITLELDSIDHYYTLGQKDAIIELENILAKSGKNNVLIMGDPGVGKHNVVAGFAQNVSKGKVVETLRYRHIFKLETARVLAGSKEEVEARLIRIFDESVMAGNVVLFIENFADLISGQKDKVGSIDASSIILPYLSSGRLQIIATVGYEDYKYKISANSSIKNSFSTIEIKESTTDETVDILIDEIIVFIEYKHNVFFTYQSVKKVVELCNRYIHNKPFPEKAIDIMQEAAVYMSNQKSKLITPEIIEQIISKKTKVPVTEAKNDEKKTLLNLEKFLHLRIIGQNQAVDAIANAMRRARAGLVDKNKPLGSFLFLGPTGVGKTETAKALAEAYFKSEKNIVRFDMSEFQEARSIDELIGSSHVTGEAASRGRLTSTIEENPYSLVLLDEIEKAHPNILNLLLQVLDDGRLTDSAGRTVDFTNTIIIATSNAGSEQIRQAIKDNNNEVVVKEILDYLQKQGIFKPEFINRFTSVICFKPLTINEITQVAELMINKLKSQLKAKDIKLDISVEAIKKLAEMGYDPLMGARPMQRIIQEKLENMLAQRMLKDDIQRGQIVKIGIEDLK